MKIFVLLQRLPYAFPAESIKEKIRSTNFFVNYPVTDLKKTLSFCSALGFTYNPQFTDENAACMVIREDIYAMLLVKDFFKSFITKGIADTTNEVEVIVTLSAESRAAVDAMAEKAQRAGAALSETRDHGWMHQRGFTDLDGHHWEVFYMGLRAMPCATVS